MGHGAVNIVGTLKGTYHLDATIAARSNHPLWLKVKLLLMSRPVGLFDYDVASLKASSAFPLLTQTCRTLSSPHMMFSPESASSIVNTGSIGSISTFTAFNAALRSALLGAAISAMGSDT